MLGASQRGCRKNPGSKNVQKNIPQQAEKQPKYCRNVVRNTKNQMLFSVSLPLFKNNFWKVTYSTVSTVCVTRGWAECGFCLRAGKTRSQKKACKPRRLPHVGCTLCWHAFGLEKNFVFQRTV